MKHLLKISITLLLMIFIYSCNNDNNVNPVVSKNGKEVLNDNIVSPHYISYLSVVQNIPKRSVVIMNRYIDTNRYSFITPWIDFSSVDNAESFDLWCGMIWDIPQIPAGVFTYNIFEIRDLSNNIVYTKTLIKYPNSLLQDRIDFSEFGINLNSNQSYQYRIQLLSFSEEGEEL
jgi:hypothetical protein